jgi:hypothetical protein
MACSPSPALWTFGAAEHALALATRDGSEQLTARIRARPGLHQRTLTARIPEFGEYDHAA